MISSHALPDIFRLYIQSISKCFALKAYLAASAALGFRTSSCSPSPRSASPALPTCRTDESQAANVFWVLRGIDASYVPPHGSANQMKGPSVQLDALHELAGEQKERC